MRLHHERLRARVAVFVSIAVVALAVDRISKLWALSALSGARSIQIIPGLLSFTLVRNPGASLGVGSSVTWLITVLAAVVSVALAVFAIRTTSMVWTVALSLAFSGAVGNLIDRVWYAEGFLNGKVIDFLNYGWSVGNVADIILVAAGVFIALLIIIGVPLMDHETADREPAGQ